MMLVEMVMIIMINIIIITISSSSSSSIMCLIVLSYIGDDGDDDDDKANKDDELRADAVENFLDLMNRPKIPDILSQSIAWVLGEYGYLSTSSNKEKIMHDLCDLSNRCNDVITKAQIVSAIVKLVAQNGSCPNKVMQFMIANKRSVSTELQQRSIEFCILLNYPNTMVDVLPVDASCEDIEVMMIMMIY